MQRKFLKADLHIHTSHSFDCATQPREVVRAAERIGLGVIGVTDHGTRAGGLEAAKVARKIRVLVGQEVKTRQGDVLVFDIDRDLEQGQDCERTCREAKELGGFIIIPHPFDPFREVTGKGTDRILKYADAIEGFNPKCFFGWSNRKAEEYARKHGLPAVASSDAHRAEEVGRAYTLLEGADPFQAIQNGRVSMVRSRVDKVDLIKKRVKKILGDGRA